MGVYTCMYMPAQNFELSGHACNHVESNHAYLNIDHIMCLVHNHANVTHTILITRQVLFAERQLLP